MNQRNSYIMGSILSLLLTASLLGTSPLWLDGQEIFPGVYVLSSHISLTETQKRVPIVSPQLTDLFSFSYPKCHPSQPMPEPEPVHTGVLSAEHVNMTIMFILRA